MGGLEVSCPSEPSLISQPPLDPEDHCIAPTLNGEMVSINADSRSHILADLFRIRWIDVLRAEMGPGVAEPATVGCSCKRLEPHAQCCSTPVGSKARHGYICEEIMASSCCRTYLPVLPFHIYGGKGSRVP